jgi:ABC-type sulfate transport system permease component
MYKLRVRLLALLVGLIMVLPALAQIAETPKIRLKQVSQVQSTGDVRSTIDLTFSTRLYTQLRSEVNNTSLLLREFGHYRTRCRDEGLEG